MEIPLSFTAGQHVGDDLWVSVLDGGPRHSGFQAACRVG
jgi:hypothetical protein